MFWQWLYWIEDATFETGVRQILSCNEGGFGGSMCVACNYTPTRGLEL